jgi:prepilin peptidase CpaA
MADTLAPSLALLLESAFAVAMLVAAGFDIAWRRLPNWLTAAVALAFLPWAWAVGASGIGFAIALGLGAVVLAIGYGLFAAGIIGGGDAKMAAAIALWIGLSPTFIFDILRFFLIMSLAGGVLAVLVLIGQAAAKDRLRRPLPYGVAIAIAALDYWSRHGQAACLLTAC